MWLVQKKKVHLTFYTGDSSNLKPRTYLLHLYSQSDSVKLQRLTDVVRKKEKQTRLNKIDQ